MLRRGEVADAVPLRVNGGPIIYWTLKEALDIERVSEDVLVKENGLIVFHVTAKEPQSA